MDISPEQAREALASIEKITRQTKKAIAQSGGGQMLVIWGSIWVIGFIGTHFMQGTGMEGLLWMVLNSIGAILTYLFTRQASGRIRTQGDNRLGLLWLSLMVYSILLFFVFPTVDPRQIVMVFVLVSMLGYVLMGIWLKAPVIGWTGVLTTIAALISYLFFSEIFFLLMAIFGGGTLIGAGLYILKKWG